MEEFLRRFQRLGFGAQAPSSSPAVDPQELEPMIVNAVRTALAGLSGLAPTAQGKGPPEQPPENGKHRKEKRPAR
jgi:hypothetical protein